MMCIHAHCTYTHSNAKWETERGMVRIVRKNSRIHACAHTTNTMYYMEKIHVFCDVKCIIYSILYTLWLRGPICEPATVSVKIDGIQLSFPSLFLPRTHTVCLSLSAFNGFFVFYFTANTHCLCEIERQTNARVRKHTTVRLKTAHTQRPCRNCAIKRSEVSAHIFNAVVI